MEESNKVVFIPSNSLVNERMIAEFSELLGFIDIRKLRRKLRTLTLNFVANESEYLSDNLHEFLHELNILFDFLDAVEDELQKEDTA